jgi:hypothetical protein
MYIQRIGYFAPKPLAGEQDFQRYGVLQVQGRKLAVIGPRGYRLNCPGVLPPEMNLPLAIPPVTDLSLAVFSF